MATEGKSFDFIVVGGGMAGAAAAAHLSRRGRVALLERETQAGYHSTGRSAALFSTIYGNATVRALTRASQAFLFESPAWFTPTPLVRPRSTLFFATPGQLAMLAAFRDDADIAADTHLLDVAEAHALVPAFKPGYLGGAVLEPGSADIDVDALHQGYLRQAKAAGATVVLECEVTRLERTGGRWEVGTRSARYDAPVVVNAAGAWADEVARLAGRHRHRRELLFQARCGAPAAVAGRRGAEPAVRRAARGS